VKKENGKANLLLADGRELLREALPDTVTDDDLAQAAIREIMFLVTRDLVDIMPLLREIEGSPYCIQLPYVEMAKARKVAFLRGHIPYLTNALANQIGKRFWQSAKRMPKNTPEIFTGNLTNIHAYSCDWICGEFPEHLHADVYANGRPGGGRGFNREDIFDIADKEGIELGSIPMHPLEQRVLVIPTGPDKKKPRLRNDLPAPEDEVKSTAHRYPIDEAFVQENRESKGGMVSDKTFSNIIKRIKLDAREEVYIIQDKPANRYQMMQYIPWAITEGMTLREICRGINGTPTMLEIARWLQYYPDFRRELEIAEGIQAHTFVDQAQEIVMGLSSTAEKGEIAVAKVQSNFLMQRAALQSEKFREKKVIQTENLDNKNEAEVKRKLKMLLRGEVVSDIIEVESFPPSPKPVPEFGGENADQ
jgi:hypothetical protein